MTLERKGFEPIKKTDKIKNDLENFLKYATVGSAKFQGFMDYLNQEKLEEERDNLIHFPLLENTDSERRHRESRLRTVEEKIALSEHTIDQKCMQMPGYYQAYYTIWGAFDELGYRLYEEGRDLYPGDEDEVERFVVNQWDDTLEKTRVDLSERPISYLTINKN